MSFQDTDVFELSSLEDVTKFCRQLLEQKASAPESLAFTVAITARRDVELRHVPGAEFQPLLHGLRKAMQGNGSRGFAVRRARPARDL